MDAKFEKIKKTMLRAGAAGRMAEHYLSYISEERESDFPSGYMEWAHENGFIASHAAALGVDKGNIGEFVSDYDYYRSWPHNGWLKLWINDKLTLKYMLDGTEYGSAMPEYYYYVTPDGRLRSLVDNPDSCTGFDGLKQLLCAKGSFACKPNNGQESVGFHRLSAVDGSYFVDGEGVREDDLEEFVLSCRNYIFTEYIVAGGGLEAVSPQIHTLRVVVVDEGNGPEIAGGYLRFPVSCLGPANYARSLAGTDGYMCYAKVNFETGEVSDLLAVYAGKKIPLDAHPDTGGSLPAGYKIPNWEDARDMVLGISRRMVDLELLGFDLGVTPNGFKIMEINSLPGAMGCQWSRDVTDNSAFIRLVRSKCAAIDAMNDEGRSRRNALH